MLETAIFTCKILTCYFEPADLRTVSDTTDFKNELKIYLLKSAFDIH